jgi:hypothetical protein
MSAPLSPAVPRRQCTQGRRPRVFLVSAGVVGLILGLSACSAKTGNGLAASTTTRVGAGSTSSPTQPSTPASPTSTTSEVGPASAPTTRPTSPAGVPGTCHARGSGLYSLPDPSCTPGAVNPAVTQATLDQTICVVGWTQTVRPPVSYTEPLKYQQMAAYGDAGPASAYEEDHLVPLELGGSPTDPRNLWPEPGGSPNPKDAVETAAKRAVCSGAMTLAAAQQAIAADWIGFGHQLGVVSSPAPAAQAPATLIPTCSATASYNPRYGDWDVYVHSNQPDQTVTVTASGGTTASWHTDGTGAADVYLHAGTGASGQQVSITVGGASCSTML